jgi:hypothetical protein
MEKIPYIPDELQPALEEVMHNSEVKAALRAFGELLVAHPNALAKFREYLEEQ